MTTPVDSPATTNMADDEDAQPEVLLPCAVCGRKFNPRSLDKHFNICERTAAKKRKPFDSARQRIKGTELAEFLPKQQHHHEPAGIGGPAASSGHPKEPARSTHHHHRPTPSGAEHDTARARKSNQAWKQTRDEFLRAIRAARGDVPAPSQSQQHSSSSAGYSPPERQQQHHHGNGPASSSQAPQQRPSTLSLVSASGPPQRSNEKGQCPTCQRQFGVKSYERHVAFCKERATRLPASPQTSNNVAKERLDARMKYRAPALKNRRPTNREKYSPGGAQKVMLASPLLGKASVKESSTSMTMKNAETATPKLPILKRPSQASKESPTSNSGPLKSRPMDRSNSGVGEDYNPFLLAEQQLNDLFSDTSDQSSTDGSAICPPKKPNSSPAFPLSHSSAFVKYPNSANSHLPSQSQSQNQQQQQSSTEPKQQQQQRISLIAPPTGFDDLTSSDLSSDCTETNSLSRELLTSSSVGSRSHQNEGRELGRRLIIDQSQALGGGEFAPAIEQQSKQNGGSRLARPLANRSNSMRAASAPKPPERKISSSSSSGSSDLSRPSKPNDLPGQQQQLQRANNNNYKNGLNGSNLSLSSIISSTDLEMKRSNSLFDELLSSFEDDVNSSSTLPSLMSLMRSDHSVSILSSTPQQNGCHQRQPAHGRINCSDDDAELSSPESVKRQECGGKLSADSAYSSLNRKYSTHNGRSANDVSNGNQHSKLKLSKFCHECGCKFPDSAKFCCECGVKRLTI